MDAAVFMKVVVPLMLMTASALFTITTVSDDSTGHFQEMLKLPRPDGNGYEDKLFKQYQFSVVCPACLKLGIVAKCKHREKRLAPWHSMRKLKYVEAMMSTQPADLAREAYGVNVGDQSVCFDKRDAATMFSLPTIPTTNDTISHIFVAVDPNTGKHDASATNKSDFAMVSGYQTSDGFVICGLESIESSDPSHHLPQFIAHIRALRGRPGCLDSMIVFIIENNLGQEAGWLQREIHQAGFTMVVVMSDTELKTGVPTDAPLKKEMMILLRGEMLKQQVLFARDVVTSYRVQVADDDRSPEHVAHARGVDAVKKCLHDQILEYRAVRIVSKTNSVIAAPRVHYTGKTGFGGKDDLCVALQLLLIWRQRFISGDKYARWQ